MYRKCISHLTLRIMSGNSIKNSFDLINYQMDITQGAGIVHGEQSYSFFFFAMLVYSGMVYWFQQSSEWFESFALLITLSWYYVIWGCKREDETLLDMRGRSERGRQLHLCKGVKELVREWPRTVRSPVTAEAAGVAQDSQTSRGRSRHASLASASVFRSRLSAPESRVRGRHLTFPGCFFFPPPVLMWLLFWCWHPCTSSRTSDGWRAQWNLCVKWECTETVPFFNAETVRVQWHGESSRLGDFPDRSPWRHSKTRSFPASRAVNKRINNDPDLDRTCENLDYI